MNDTFLINEWSLLSERREKTKFIFWSRSLNKKKERNNKESSSNVFYNDCVKV